MDRRWRYSRHTNRRSREWRGPSLPATCAVIAPRSNPDRTGKPPHRVRAAHYRKAGSHENRKSRHQNGSAETPPDIAVRSRRNPVAQGPMHSETRAAPKSPSAACSARASGEDTLCPSADRLAERLRLTPDASPRKPAPPLAAVCCRDCPVIGSTAGLPRGPDGALGHGRRRGETSRRRSGPPERCRCLAADRRVCAEAIRTCRRASLPYLPDSSHQRPYRRSAASEVPMSPESAARLADSGIRPQSNDHPPAHCLRHSREMTLLCSRNPTQQPAFGGDDIALPTFDLRTKARRPRVGHSIRAEMGHSCRAPRHIAHFGFQMDLEPWCGCLFSVRPSRAAVIISVVNSGMVPNLPRFWLSGLI